jgi:hypothetical protein
MTGHRQSFSGLAVGLSSPTSHEPGPQNLMSAIAPQCPVFTALNRLKKWGILPLFSAAVTPHYGRQRPCIEGTVKIAPFATLVHSWHQASRRDSMRWLAGGVLGGVLTRLDTDGAWAEKNRRKKRKKCVPSTPTPLAYPSPPPPQLATAFCIGKDYCNGPAACEASGPRCNCFVVDDGGKNVSVCGQFWGLCH